MKKIALIISLTVIVALISYAFEKPKPQQPQQTINLKLSIDQVNTILKGLGKLPFEESSQTILAIQIQATQQLTPAPDSTKTKPKKN